MNNIARELVGDRLAEPAELQEPAVIRTPGRTWTDAGAIDVEAGQGTVTVDAPDAVDVLQLDEAHAEHPEAVEAVFFNQLDPAANTYTARHVDYLEDTIFIRVPRGTAVDEPVRITAQGRDGFFPHHVLVYAEDGASVSIVEENTGTADWSSAFTEVFVGEDAVVNYTKINALEAGNGYSENAARVQDNGTMNWLMLSTGAELYRNDITTRLAGSHSALQYRLGFLAAAEQHMDHTAHVIHDGDNTRCNMDSRGVAMEQARTIYKGVQEVKETTTGTKSFQDEKTVMIGDACEADTTPQLRIENNEVEATHAATTGHIDDVDLFYLQSRGLSENLARKEIVTGMFDDLIENETARDTIHAKIRETLQ